MMSSEPVTPPAGAPRVQPTRRAEPDASRGEEKAVRARLRRPFVSRALIAARGGARRAGRALRFAEHVLAALGACFVVYHLLFDVSVVASGSMAPTLQGESVDDGDWVLTERLTFLLRRPRRWEVVAFHAADGLHVMKRVVGLPGETVALDEEAKAVVIDGRPVARPGSIRDVEYFACGKLRRGKAAPAGEGYFVLGDDSRDSWDSRFDPPVRPRRIVGRAWLRVWPPSRIGFVNP